ncbi:hypothetical protein LRS05_03095 [Flavobacterium sp. J372]|uniref:hypothetical protein n=1 Tax=Flavobacterium sp. J372 TaxID=2898436 RepID=UPI0021512DC5|nr:hypothetical protein [Flavobacterium sp. J372]MCR5861190.1 hypothetical protein [Flavobacterium sp. J372]
MISKAFYRRPLFYASFIVIAIGVSGLYSNLQQKAAYARSTIVYAGVLERPNDCENLTKWDSYAKVRYQEKVYVMKITRSNCESLIQDKVVVRFDHESNSLFFPDEKFVGQIASSAAIALIGLIIAFIGWKRM